MARRAAGRKSEGAAPVARDRGAAATGRRPAPAGSKSLVTAAWALVLVASILPDIAFVEVTGGAPTWLAAAKVGILLAAVVASFVWAAVRPLRPFALVMVAFLVLFQLVERLDLTWLPLQSLFGGTAFDERMQAEQTGKLLVTVVMIGVLLALGYRRRDFFLARGNLRAPIKPVRVLGFPRPDPWTSFGLQWGLYIALALGVVLYLGVRPTGSELAAVVPMLPAILFYAALNAFNEEMTYRAPMIATLEPVGGSSRALAQSAVFFGVAHYFGVPGGLLGAALSVFMGWLLGKAMVETRGLFWSWWIHALSDVAIFTFLAVGLLR